MSYNGYEVWLCANGHRTEFDAFNSPMTFDGDIEGKCDCGAEFIWWQPVDLTNPLDDENNGLYPGEEIVNQLTVKREAIFYQCTDPKCGCRKMVEDTIYNLPPLEIGHHLFK